MSRVNELEQQVKQLNPRELAAFRQWFRKFDSDLWDREIDAAAHAGRLDDLADEALEQHRRGDSSAL